MKLGLASLRTNFGHAPLALALLALALQLLFPTGFMPGSSAHGGGLSIVICTGQGQITANWDDLSGSPHKSPAPGKSTGSCPFAGHVVGPAPHAPPLLSEPVAFEALAQASVVRDSFPGRGLAAPPPPAIGPPVSI